MLEELIGHLIVFAVRVGESPMEAKSRRWWDRLSNRWFWLSLLLLGIAAALGVRRNGWW